MDNYEKKKMLTRVAEICEMMLGEGKARVCRGAMHTCMRNGGEAKWRDGDCSNAFSIVDDRNKTDAHKRGGGYAS